MALTQLWKLCGTIALFYLLYVACSGKGEYWRIRGYEYTKMRYCVDSNIMQARRSAVAATY
jgi:hypothetical protein